MNFGTRSQVVLSQAAAVGALLTCFGVVLGVGGVSRFGPQHVAMSSAGPGSGSGSGPVIPTETLPVADIDPSQVVDLGQQPPYAVDVPRAADVQEAAVVAAVGVEATEPPPAATGVAPPQEGDGARAEAQVVPVMEVAEPAAPGPDPSLTDRDGGVPQAASQPTIIGVWAPDASACTLRTFRQGLLPTIIDNDGAWAGDTFCTFKNQKQTETGWRVVANCSNADGQWTTSVRLTLKGDRLTWASRRGTQVYTRCARDFLLAGVQ